MAYLLSDYRCKRKLPEYKVINDDWYVPNIFDDEDIDRRYDGWLYKPQYRIVEINLKTAPYAVFDETQDRKFIGLFDSMEKAHVAGEKACGK